VSDWVLATEESGFTRHFGAEAMPVLIGGGSGNDLTLAGVRGSVQIGLLDGVFFVQPGRDTENLRLNGDLLRGSRKLGDGDQIALDSARLAASISGGRLRLAIEAQVTAGDTAPPDFEALARSERAEVAIAPVSFKPAAADAGKRRARRLSKASIAVYAAFSVLAVLGWFAFTAKSVELELSPVADEIGLPDTLFQLRLGDRYLLRQGTHRLTAALEGYYPIDQTIRVGPLADQTVQLEFQKLPGLISFAVEPPVAAEIKVDGKPIGQAPLTDFEIVPGTHQIELTAERYLSEVRSLDVEGGHVRQSLEVELTPSWAPVSVTSEPAGAEVLIDGQPVGRTPAMLELTAGERVLELRLPGYNAWRDRVLVVADEPQTVPTIGLRLADGRLTLASAPSDASVSVDGEYRGRTPIELTLRPERAHRISIAKPGFATANRELTVAADSGRRIEVELEPQYGAIDVVSEPAGAEVWVDGDRVGTTPTRLDLLAVAQSIELRLAGFASDSREITPRPGYPQTLELELEELDELTGSGYARTIRTALDQELRLIPAGSFTMGSSRREQGRRSNEVLREVELSRAFYLGVREVTNAEFRAFMAEHDSGRFGGNSLDDDEQPVVNVSWAEAAEFLNWLSIQDGLQPVYAEGLTGMAAVRPLRNGYRLPTEAEWAWAARAAGREAELLYPWGDSLPPPDRFANLADLSAAEILPTTLVTYNDGFPVTAPVGSFDRNAVGIYDLGGNVAEWVQDFYEVGATESPGPVTDPLGPESGRFHVFRGPGWRSATLTELRYAARDYEDNSREDLGFRIARNLE
jgi:formylglycine-generating enzyme required for sulfatase activity